MLALAVLCAVPAAPAFAESVSELGRAYQVAVLNYETVVDEQEQNADEIELIERDITVVEEQIEISREQLGTTVTSLYKTSCDRNPILELVLNASSFSDAVMRYDTYRKVEEYYVNRARTLQQDQVKLGEQLEQLEQKKAEIEQRVLQAQKEVEAAQQALVDAVHSDGDKYHQVQGNGVNCGATAFIVGVNILLHENRFPDNVEVWEGPGFQRDSTNNLALRAKAWLLAKGLAKDIEVEEVKGDITTIDALREQLEEGKVVVISSGGSSQFLRKAGTASDADEDEDADDEDRSNATSGSDSGNQADQVDDDYAVFPDGHWIVFYHYEDGIFYANDSSVMAAKGAGVPYDEDAMKQWLEGRGTHFATILSKK